MLLDIEMGKMDGVTMAKKLRRDDDTVQIIFITGYSDYILEGYEVEALHYLLKPIRQEKLFSVLDRAAEKAARKEKILNFGINGEMVRIPTGRIVYADVAGNYVTVHAGRDVTVKMTLGELERELDERFYRVSRSAVSILPGSAALRKKRSECVMEHPYLCPEGHMKASTGQ